MRRFILLTCFSFFISCNNNKEQPSITESITNLKRGTVISCGPQEGEIFGKVSFDATIPSALQKDFNTAIALLHSFEYDEAEKMFAKIIDASPGCAMAYWGVAMSNFHPVWMPPTSPELQKGLQAINISRSIKNKTKRESDYIEALAQFYEHADEFDHRSRVLKFEKAMETLYQTYPEDKDPI